MIEKNNFLCLECINDLPHTHFAQQVDNPIEKIFWGRIAIASAMSELYFSKGSIVQNLIHEFKYKGNSKVGYYLGNLIGKSLLASNRFNNIDALIPIPLFKKKEMKRGYNQSEILCEGIAAKVNLPVIKQNVVRTIPTQTQTKKSRTERWKNVDKTFQVLNPALLAGKHILLVDDVITTGATLEACASSIIQEGTQVSIATLAMAT